MDYISGDMEWINEYPALKQVNPVNPFKVPEGYFQGAEQHLLSFGKLPGQGVLTHGGFILEEGYFDKFENNLLSVINLGNILDTSEDFLLPENYFDELSQNLQASVVIEGVLNDKIFAVPENYFDQLGVNIQSRITVEDALNEQKDFSIPENYFEELHSNILSRVAIEEVLNDPGEFTVPQNYFEELAGNIESRVLVADAISENNFTVPINYFENLEAGILNKTVKATQREREKGVVRKLWATAAFKYASAACFSLVVGGAIFISEFNSTSAQHNRTYLHKELAKVSANEIESYLQLNGDSHAILENSDPNNLSVLEDGADQQ